MNWKVLYDLYNGLLGKCLIFIALSTPVSILVRNTGIYPKSFIISLIGAIIILLGYVACQISTPAIIKKFSDSHTYSEYLIKIEKNVTLSIEFSVLDDVKNKLPTCHDDISLDKFEFVSVEDTKNRCNFEKSIRILSFIKYAYFSQVNFWLRVILTVTMAIGSIFIFFPTLYNIYTILGVVSNV
ncbi:TPA: hypothetical protein QIC04_003568 [Morganella morganii subsp. morganii]|uniref:SMODS and SLOG-associating 2TM effector domain-containing protein n=1 Tax=Morganella morganii subsp. morganii KT TaxID=1124991 RepID=M1SXK8_MORMO|nr:hypothetical protein [Morganella morganii]AGG31737.1 hypothetical protein MU9_2692 [Morganella morganii subsp. morganii KT]HDT0713779.1 hypothetical protein [Morganella morganii subsp. morganii]HDT4951667.1 hypothetical protein [Morganella morganii subsp. morganii]